MGVETVVVRGSLLRGEQKRKLSPGALERTGLKRLASFPGGDSVWKIDFDVDRTTCLDVVPQVDLDGVSLLFAPSSACRAPRPTGQGDGAPDSWRDTSAVCAEAGGVSSHALDDAVSGGACAPGQRRIPARDADVCCAEERLFFVNPKKCALQRAIVTAQDARGVRRSKEIEFQLPLVVTDPIAAGDWRPTSAEMERPIRVVSLTSQDAFLRTRKDLDR